VEISNSRNLIFQKIFTCEGSAIRSDVTPAEFVELLMKVEFKSGSWH